MHASTKGALIGGALGTGIGALGGLPKKHYNIQSGKWEKATKRGRITRAVAGAIGGGIVGAAHGYDIGNLYSRGGSQGYHYSYQRPHGQEGYSAKAPRPPGPKPKIKPDWLKDAKTKSEARRAYHAQARKHHTDLGGNEDAMKTVNSDWEQWQGHFKEAMYAAFADELMKIGSIGAALGGTAGYVATPGGLKNKLVGAAVGAGVGHVVGHSASAIKKEVWDNPRDWERQQLYGYTPGY